MPGRGDGGNKQADAERKDMKLTIEINIARIGSGYIALSSPGGMQMRGRRADTKAEAARSLLENMSKSEDGEIALDLLIEGKTIEGEMKEIGN